MHVNNYKLTKMRSQNPKKCLLIIFLSKIQKGSLWGTAFIFSNKLNYLRLPL
jgi:hypothetical protein